MPKIWKKLSSTLASLFSIMRSCKILLFLLPKVNEIIIIIILLLLIIKAPCSWTSPGIMGNLLQQEIFNYTKLYWHLENQRNKDVKNFNIIELLLTLLKCFFLLLARTPLPWAASTKKKGKKRAKKKEKKEKILHYLYYLWKCWKY